MFEMRDGTRVQDARLGRLQQFDERSRKFGIATALDKTTLRSKTWGVPGEKLDQGREGACVGFGITHELVAYPMSNLGLTAKFARERVYYEAQRRDPWPGGEYPGASPVYGGTSVLAGIKVAKALGYFDSYRWAFNVDQLAAAVAWEGPVVVGTNWLEGMFEPRPSGRLLVEGSSVGGHCYLITGLTLSPRLAGEPSIPMFRIRNSWGPTWGRYGDAFISVEDFERYLTPGGEAVVPLGRKKLSAAAAARPTTLYRGGHGNVGLVDWNNVRGWRVA
jgi:hypothetical protein